MEHGSSHGDIVGLVAKFDLAYIALKKSNGFCRGGLDAFLAKASDAELSAKALKVKKDIAKAQAAA